MTGLSAARVSVREVVGHSTTERMGTFKIHSGYARVAQMDQSATLAEIEARGSIPLTGSTI